MSASTPVLQALLYPLAFGGHTSRSICGLVESYQSSLAPIPSRYIPEINIMCRGSCCFVTKCCSRHSFRGSPKMSLLLPIILLPSFDPRSGFYYSAIRYPACPFPRRPQELLSLLSFLPLSRHHGSHASCCSLLTICFWFRLFSRYDVGLFQSIDLSPEAHVNRLKRSQVCVRYFLEGFAFVLGR